MGHDTRQAELDGTQGHRRVSVDAFVIRGGRRLSGRITINGSKNAALPLLAASLMTDQPVTLRNVPRLADINNMRRLLSELGVTDTESDDPSGRRDITLRTADFNELRIPRADVETFKESDTSIMPAGVDQRLTRTELADVIAFLASMKERKP